MKATIHRAPDSARRLALLSAPLILLAGCGGTSSLHTGSTVTSGTSVLKGRLMGGQLPISGASVELYEVGNTGYGTPPTALLSAPVTTGQDGSFTITGDYTCPASNPETYIVASGGIALAGGSNNSAILLMAALGPCQTDPSIPFIVIDEVTTIASVWTLAPFMNYGAQVGTLPTNTSGLADAFTNAGYLANIGTGLSPGPSVPQGITVPTAEIYTMANILAYCVNSSGTTPCNTLFSDTTPSGGPAPLTTFDAALNMVRNPALNVPSLFALSSSNPPFQSGLTSPPASWSLGNAMVDNPVPAISSLSPQALAAGAAPQALTINGSGFLASSTVTFNGTSHAATYFSSSELTIALTTADLASAATDPIVVTNPGPGGGPSTAANFVVTSDSATTVTVTFLSPTVAAAEVRIGSGAFAPATVSADTLTLSVPAGTTDFAVAYVCVPIINGSGTSQTQTIFQTLIEANIADGTSYYGDCYGPPSSGQPTQFGALTYDIDASAIAGANDLFLETWNGTWQWIAGLSLPTASGSAQIPVGNNVVDVLADDLLPGECCIANTYLLAAREYDSQVVPGQLNEGNSVVLGAADQTTPQSITYQNIPAGYTQASISADYVSSEDPTIQLARNVNSFIASYPALPAAMIHSGGYYYFAFDAYALSGFGVVEQTATNGGPLSIQFPQPWNYSGPAPAALPTFDFSTYTAFAGMSGVIRDAGISWNTSNGSIINDYSVEATANAMGGAASITMPDLSGLIGFLAPPASGTPVIWTPATTQQNFQGFVPDSPGDTLFTVNAGGSYTVP